MSGWGFAQILGDYLIPFAKRLFGNNAILHMDNATTHKTPACKALLRASGLTYIKAPAYSADLNPIEVSIIFSLIVNCVYNNLSSC
jgi:hypothetical protein